METGQKASRLAIDTDVLLSTFQLAKIPGGKTLETWLQASGELTPWQTELFELVYQKSINRMSGWNEEELKMKFVSFLFLIADIEVDHKISTFFERPLAATIAGHYLSVICDCLVATPLGYNTPQHPYFFMQEFKKQKGDSYDPEAQMLAAMLIAQQQNADGKPLYGAWLTGGIWFFTVLEGTNYLISNAFDATQKSQLRQIIFILRHLKTLILQR